MYNPAAAVAQSVPMTNLDFTNVIHIAQTAAHNQHLPVAESQSQPPAYNTLASANEYQHLPVAETQSQPPAYNTLASANEYKSTTTAQGEKKKNQL